MSALTRIHRRYASGEREPSPEMAARSSLPDRESPAPQDCSIAEEQHLHDQLPSARGHHLAEISVLPPGAPVPEGPVAIQASLFPLHTPSVLPPEWASGPSRVVIQRSSVSDLKTKQPVYQQDAEDRPILAAALLRRNPTGPRDKHAEDLVSKPLTQLMEELGSPVKYHAAHLIAHRFGGDPGVRNLVPLEARVNTSYMKVAENDIAAILDRDPDAQLYATVRVTYHDPPKELSEPFESKRSINPQSRYKRKVAFSFMDLRRVPDEIHYQVVDLRTDQTVIDENFFPGGPLMEYLGATRRELEEKDPALAGRVLNADQRRELIAELKAR